MIVQIGGQKWWKMSWLFKLVVNNSKNGHNKVVKIVHEKIPSSVQLIHGRHKVRQTEAWVEYSGDLWQCLVPSDIYDFKLNIAFLDNAVGMVEI